MDQPTESKTDVVEEKTVTLKSVYKRFHKLYHKEVMSDEAGSSSLTMTADQLLFIKDTIKEYDKLGAEICVVSQQPNNVSKLWFTNGDGVPQYIGLGIGNSPVSATINAVENTKRKILEKSSKKAEKK